MVWKEFKEFALRGNVIDMAVGIIIGGAFTPIVKSLVDDVLMPPIGLLVGRVDVKNLFMVLKEGSVAGPYATVEAAQKAGAVTLNYGAFVNTVITFFIVAWVLFIVVKGINRLHRRQLEQPTAPTDKKCPYCFSTIPAPATRCPSCTSELPSAAV